MPDVVVVGPVVLRPGSGVLSAAKQSGSGSLGPVPAVPPPMPGGGGGAPSVSAIRAKSFRVSSDTQCPLAGAGAAAPRGASSLRALSIAMRCLILRAAILRALADPLQSLGPALAFATHWKDVKLSADGTPPLPLLPRRPRVALSARLL